jgi:hypothetical protein
MHDKESALCHLSEKIVMEQQELVLVEAFRTILGTDNEARKNAEALLNSYQGVPGLFPLLTKISLSENPIEIRQSAVVYLKNVSKVWKDNKREKSHPPEDKLFLMNHIIECLSLNVHELVRSQFEEIAKTIADNEFPWDSVINQIAHCLSTDQPDMLFAGLMMIYQITRGFEFKMCSKREKLDVLVNNFYGKIHEILVRLLDNLNLHSFRFISLILRIYWTSTYIDISAGIRTPESLNAWLAAFKRVLELDLGELETPVPNEEEGKVREESYAWQSKRWAAQIVHRFFHRYFSSENYKDDLVFIGQLFKSTWALPFLNTIVTNFFKYKTHFVPNIVLNYYVKYMTQALKYEPAHQLLAPHMSSVLTDYILPLLYRVPSDATLWEEDPIEYIRKEGDLGRAYYSAKSAATDFIITSSENGYLDFFLKYLATSLNSNPEVLHKEALLLAAGSIYEIIDKNEAFKNEIPNLLRNFVLPEFNSAVGFARARACWCYAQFSKNGLDSPDHEKVAIQNICRMLVDKDLPVRVEAAVALPKLFNFSVAKELVAPEIQNLLDIYLKLMGEIDSEDLVDSLELIVSEFEDQVAPFAIELSTHLSEAFLRMAVQDANKDEGESAMAAVSTLNTLSKILDAVQEKPDMIETLSHTLLPVLDFCLSIRGCEFFEEGVHLLTCMLYYCSEERLTHLYPLVNHVKAGVMGDAANKPYAAENIDDVFSPLANFIAKYKQLSLSNIGLYFELCQYLIEKDSAERILACKLLICLIENLREHINSFLPNILNLITSKFLVSDKDNQKVLYGQVICVSLWHDPATTLNILGQSNTLEPFFQWSFSNLEKYDMELAKTHAALGLTSLFNVAEYLPALLSSNLGVILKNLVELLKKIQKEHADEEEFEKELQKESNTFQSAEDLGSDYQKLLEKLKQARYDEEDEDEDDFNYICDSEDLYDSPLEKIGEIDFLEEALQNLQNRNPGLYSQIRSTLTQEEISALQGMFDSEA